MGWTTLFWWAAGGRDRGIQVFATPTFPARVPFLPFMTFHSLSLSALLSWSDL